MHVIQMLRRTTVATGVSRSAASPAPKPGMSIPVETWPKLFGKLDLRHHFGGDLKIRLGFDTHFSF
jgi:hypothetical protein